MASPLIVNIAELLRRPGSERDIAIEIKSEVFAFADSRIDDDSGIGVQLHLESLQDGIVVRGKISSNWQLACRRCLRPVADVAVTEVDELYQRVIVNPDAYPLEGEQLDLKQMVRELVLLSLPDGPLCQADCPGFCLECGSDLRTSQCSCQKLVGDERWAVLDELKSQLGE